MNQFVELLRQHREAFEAQYSNQLNQYMRDAIYAISCCQTAKVVANPLFYGDIHLAL